MTSAASYIRRRSRYYGLDPRAVLGVGRVESGLRRNAIGDQGTSFGPFQLHRGGALPAGKGAAWAGSNAGIDYALRKMAGVAKGLKGRAAIEAIVRRFERPADPGSEIRKALAFYGSSSGAQMMDAPQTEEDTEFQLGPNAVGRDAKRELSNFMLQQLAHSRATGDTMSLNNFYALNQMMTDSAGPNPEVEEKPQKIVSVGRGASPEGAVMGVGVGAGGFFPLGKANYTYGGGMAAHGSRAIGNWQSDRAVDLMAKAGTPVYATQGGIIKGGFGDSGSKGTVYGKRLSVYSKNNAFFYQHLGRYGSGIAPGRRVQKGQLLGYIGYFPGKPAPHLHYGVQRGNPFGILTGDRRRRR